LVTYQEQRRNDEKKVIMDYFPQFPISPDDDSPCGTEMSDGTHITTIWQFLAVKSTCRNFSLFVEMLSISKINFLKISPVNDI